MDQLTCTILFNLLCQDCKDTKNLNHDFHDRTRHSRGRGHLYIDLEPSEDVFYAREEIKEYILTIANSLNNLRYQDVTNNPEKRSTFVLTERRTPMPVKIAPAGWNASKMDIRGQIGGRSPQYL